MIHEMNLHETPFDLIIMGLKTIELRLNDEKRRIIDIGDHIRFTNTENHQKILVEVLEKHVFGTFKTLYEKLDLVACGYLIEELKEATADDMLIYYTLEQQHQFGVVGIKFRVIKEDF